MRDVSARSFELKEAAAERIVGLLRSRGYETIDTPLLEETELFVRKSGGELTSRLYTFVDPGGNRVSLRPEFTSSVIRSFIEEQHSVALPVRRQYLGPVFRYEGQDSGSYRQFTQVGAELIGSEGVEADAEALSLAWMAVREAGLKRCEMRVGHLGVFQELLAGIGVSEPARNFVLNNIHVLKNGDTDVSTLIQRAGDLGLLGNGPDLKAIADWSAVRTDATREFVQGVMSKAMSSPLGRRSTEQIVGRLMRKAREADEPGQLEEAVALASELASLEGSPRVTLRRAVECTEARGLSAAVFHDLERLFAALVEAGVDDADVTLDFGLAGGISYYTGVIFELTSQSPPVPIKLCAGGRYDGLVKALGGADVPALGFAYSLDNLMDALAQESGASAAPTADDE